MVSDGPIAVSKSSESTTNLVKECGGGMNWQRGETARSSVEVKELRRPEKA